MKKGMIAGVGAVGIAAAALGGVIATRDRAPEPQAASPAIAAAPANDAICIRTDIRLVEGMGSGCYTRAQFEAFRDRAVLAADANAAMVTMSAPAGFAAESASAENCADYDRMIGEGWYARTSLDMAQEQFFIRACGALRRLAGARPADVTYFANDSADESDVRSMSSDPAFRLAQANAAPASDASVAAVSSGVWRLETSTAEATVQEIAHADFNADGVGDILAYLNVKARAGTAQSGTVGIIEKHALGGPCRFVPSAP